MPEYIYTRRDESGKIIEKRSLFQGMTQERPKFLIGQNGEKCYRDLAMEHQKGAGIGTNPAIWPKESIALGVHPNQTEEAYRRSVQAGVPTEFNADGNAIITSRAHGAKYAASRGLLDRDAGYTETKHIEPSRGVAE